MLFMRLPCRSHALRHTRIGTSQKWRRRAERPDCTQAENLAFTAMGAYSGGK
jgi:hypothetical protein